MYFYFGVIALVLALILFFKTFYLKPEEEKSLFAVILLFLGILLCVYDFLLRDNDYAYFLKYEYDKNKNSHYKCHKDFLLSKKEVSFSSFFMMRCISEKDKIQKEHEFMLFREEKKENRC